MDQMLLFDDERFSSKSPLAYIGGKKKLWPLFKELLPNNTKEVISPFVGGAGLELQCANFGIKVTASDITEQLIHFWNSFSKNASAVCHKAYELFPLSRDEVLLCQKTHLNDYTDPIEKAAVYWLVNKQSFSSVTLAASGFHKRMSNTMDPKYFIDDYWVQWQNNNITFTCSDCFTVLKKHTDKMLYLDPPYVEKEHYYGLNKTDRSFDHERLRDCLKEYDGPWILSYGDHPVVRELYKDFLIVEPKWQYCITPGNDKDLNSKELMIFHPKKISHSKLFK